MANLDKNFQDLVKRLRELNVDTKEFTDSFQRAGNNAERANRVIGNMELALEGALAKAQGFHGEIGDIAASLQAMVSEMKNSESAINQSVSAASKLNKVAQDLRSNEAGLVDLSMNQLKAKSDIVETQAAYIRNQRAQIAQEVEDLKNQDRRTPADEKRLANGEALLQLIRDREASLKSIQTVMEKRIQQEKAILESAGLTGAALSAASSIASKFGMSHITEDLDDIKKTLDKDIRKAVKANGDEALGFGAKFGIAAKGIGKASAAIAKGLMDPLFIIGKILTAFNAVDKAAVGLQNSIGRSGIGMSTMNTRLATSVDFLESATELTRMTGMNALAAFGPDVIANVAEFKNELGLSVEEAGKLAMIAKTSGQSLDQVGETVADTVSSFNKVNRAGVAQGVIMRDVANTSEDIKLSLGNNPKLITEAAASARRLGMELSKVDQIAGSLMDFESSIEAELEAQLLTGRNINMAKARELALNNDLAGLSKELFKNSASIAEFGKMNRIQQEAQAKALGMSRQELAKVAYQRALETGMTQEAAAAAADVRLEDMRRMEVQEKLNKALNKLAQAAAPLIDAFVPFVDLVMVVVGPMAKLTGLVASFIGSVVKLLTLDFKGFTDGFSGIGSIFKEGTKDAGGFLGLIKEIGIGLAGFAAVKSLGGGGFLASLFSSSKGIGTLTKNYKALQTAQASGLSPKQIAAGFGGKAAKEAAKMTALQTAAVKVNTVVTRIATAIQKAFNVTLSAGAKIIKFALLPAKYALRAAMTVGNVVVGLLTAGYNRLTASQTASSLATVRATIAERAARIGRYLSIKAQALQNALNNTWIGQQVVKLGHWIKETAALGASTVAKLTNAGATVTQASANTGLATSQAAVGATGTAAAGGLAAAGAALGAFGTAAAPAIPILLAIGGALLLASPAIYAFGLAIKAAFDGIANIVTAVGGAISTMLTHITMDKALAMLALGPALLGVSAGLVSLGTASLFALPGIATLGALSLMASPLSTLGNSLTVVAAGIAAVATALSTLETEKLSELKDLVMTTAVAAPMVAASGAITEMIAGIAGSSKKEGEGQSNTDLINKIDELIAVVKQGGDVYIDGNKAGQALVLASTKLS